MTIRTLVALATVLAASATIGARADDTSPVLEGSTLDCGGGTSTGGDFVLTGTIGQPDAEVTPLAGETFTLAGGFAPVGDPPSPCPADLDDNGTVAFSDLLTLLSEWGPCSGACPADLDGSGAVGFADLLVLLSAWGPCN